MKQIPLRYSISDWHQLIDCQSNNSTNLSIRVSDIIQDRRLKGTLIQVVHKDFGVLFAALVNGSGIILTHTDGFYVHQLPVEQILKELHKFGFMVKYSSREALKPAQLEFLMAVDKLGYDKIRLLTVWSTKTGVKTNKVYVVAFNYIKNGEWLNNGYSPSETEFLEALENGSAFNMTDVSDAQKFRWDWLDYVADIQDILRDNIEK